MNLVEVAPSIRAVQLPCNVGDTVYLNDSWQSDYERAADKPHACEVVLVALNEIGGFINTKNIKTERMQQFDFNEIGRKVFLTKEDARINLEAEQLEGEKRNGEL